MIIPRNCMHHVVTFQGCFPHIILRTVWDLCVIVFIFLARPTSYCLINAILLRDCIHDTPQGLHPWCNFTGVFSSLKSLTSSTLAFFWPSWTLDLNCLFIMITSQYVQAWYCNFAGMFSTTRQTSNKFNIDHCLTFLNIGTSSRSNCLVNAVTNQELHSLLFFFYLYCDFLLKISDKFNMDLCQNIFRNCIQEL